MPLKSNVEIVAEVQEAQDCEMLDEIGDVGLLHPQVKDKVSTMDRLETPDTQPAKRCKKSAT